MMILYVVLFGALFMLFYLFYMIIREGISRVLKLYFISFTGWNNHRKGYKYSDAILALKKLNYIL